MHILPPLVITNLPGNRAKVSYSSLVRVYDVPVQIVAWLAVVNNHRPRPGTKPGCKQQGHTHAQHTVVELFEALFSIRKFVASESLRWDRPLTVDLQAGLSAFLHRSYWNLDHRLWILTAHRERALCLA